MAYTPKVKKDRLKTVIRTSCETIEGWIHKLPQKRMLDMMNNSADNFIAVSKAKVYSANEGKLLYETDFLAVNKNHVVIICGESVSSDEDQN